MEDSSKDVHEDEGSRPKSPETPDEPLMMASAPKKRPESGTKAAGGEIRRERHRVRFTAGGESLDSSNQRSTFDVRDDSTSPPSNPNRGHSMPLIPTTTHDERLNPEIDDSRKTASHSALLDHALRSSIAQSSPHHKGITKPPASVMRPALHAPSYRAGSDEPYDGPAQSAVSQLTAQERAANLARRVGTSLPVTAENSPKLSQPASPIPSGPNGLPVRVDDIPMIDLNANHDPKLDGDTESDEESAPSRRGRGTTTSEAHQLVRLHTKKSESKRDRQRSQQSPPAPSGQVTPIGDRDPDDYVAPPGKYRGGILASLLKLYNPNASPGFQTPGGSDPTSAASHHGSHTATLKSSPSSPEGTPGTGDSSGTGTPKVKHQKWYRNKSQHNSTNSLMGLMESSTMLATPAAAAGLGINPVADGRHRPRPVQRSSHPGTKIGQAINKMSRPRLEDEIRITVHIAETLARQKYLMKLCRALMYFGAPTHRLEEYMKMTARVLEIDSQFLYIPGCMIISFDDSATHTTEVKLVRTSQGVDLGKLRDTHQIYKEVVHDVIGMEEAVTRLDEIMTRPRKHQPWLLVLVYGLASACVGPFAFQARFIDLPLIFALGSLLGFLQLIVAPKSDLYSNVFEISAAVLTSFLARAFGSIRGGNLFCFSAMAQSSIALILPGYTVLCGSLELQSKSIVAGSVRMVYAIIYSLFLGFGITIGTAIYGLIDADHATSATQCQHRMPAYYAFIFVPPFTLCLIVINQAKWKQAPVMIFIAFAGYVVNFFSSRKFPSNAQISNTLGAFAIGVLGNLYSRLHHGMAAAAILPAIFVQVPSGLAASGSLVSGVQSANQITNSSNGTVGTGYTTVSSGTDTSQLNTVVFNVGYSMIQVAIGITVGLFLSALVVYPFGKRRSGLFSF